MGSNQQLETLDYGFLYFVESNYYEDVDTPSHHPLPIGLEDSKSWPKKKHDDVAEKQLFNRRSSGRPKRDVDFFHKGILVIQDFPSRGFIRRFLLSFRPDFFPRSLAVSRFGA